MSVRHHRAKILEEQVEVQGGKLHALDFDTVDNLKLLENCIKESLRLNPPLVTVMRYVRPLRIRMMASTRCSYG